FGVPLRFFRTPAVRRQRPTATLRPRRYDIAALRVEYSNRGGVDLRKELTLHATEQHTDDSTTLPDRPVVADWAPPRYRRWRQRRHRRPSRRQTAKQSTAARPAVDPQTTHRRQRPDQDPQSAWMREGG